MDPPRIIAIDDARPLTPSIRLGEGGAEELGTHVVITSLKSHMARTEPTTPRTAEETIWVMGEVTLIDNKLAMLIKKPKMPLVDRQTVAHIHNL